MERKAWWIASFPKSGNTLVRMLINAYVTRFPLDINANFQYTTVDQNYQMFQQVCSKPLNEVDPVDLVYLRPAALLNYIHSIEPRDACFKTHNANIKIDGIPLIPPRLTKQAVYIVRDPRDVAVSYAYHSRKSLQETVDIMCSDDHVGHRDYGLQDIILSWSNHVRSWQRAKFPVEIVRFEDLIFDTQKWLKVILPALGFRERPEESVIKFAVDQASFGNMRTQEEMHGFREAQGEKFFRSGQVGQWKSTMSRDQIKQIESRHDEVMREYRYIK